MEENIDAVLEELEKRGLRLTPQRMLITRIVLSMIKDHPSLREIHSKVREVLPRTGIATTFNTLRVLEETGIISKFESDGRVRYDKAVPHINLICQDTGEVVDIDNREIVEELKKIARETLRARITGIYVNAKCKD
ncbi:MAG: transcriptional repressor [Desulfurococcales archaeon]|nr:transcriptional repressor [Desulfurococcales archaeon]